MEEGVNSEISLKNQEVSETKNVEGSSKTSLKYRKAKTKNSLTNFRTLSYVLLQLTVISCTILNCPSPSQAFALSGNIFFNYNLLNILMNYNKKIIFY